MKLFRLCGHCGLAREKILELSQYPDWVVGYFAGKRTICTPIPLMELSSGEAPHPNYANDKSLHSLIRAIREEPFDGPTDIVRAIYVYTSPN